MVVSFIRRLIHYPRLFQEICPHMCSNNMMTIIKIYFDIFPKARTVVVTYGLGITNCLCENSTNPNTFNTSKNVMNTLKWIMDVETGETGVFYVFTLLLFLPVFSERFWEKNYEGHVFFIKIPIMIFKTFGYITRNIKKLIFLNAYFRNQAILSGFVLISFFFKINNTRLSLITSQSFFTSCVSNSYCLNSSSDAFLLEFKS